MGGKQDKRQDPVHPEPGAPSCGSQRPDDNKRRREEDPFQGERERDEGV
ncbi:hypothetical protein OG594_45085 [Streptomyces sp. NBC_01214]|nr:hypothetical protein [Streptomyces sp. NBC_01214]MCX4808665.1 hypothetical protein [Streptomyces sp. NBC_01214]